MDDNQSQQINQAVFRIMEKVHGQTDLNTIFAEIREILSEMLEKCQHLTQAPDPITREILSEIDHDLRTPMSGILGFAELLSEDLQDAVQKRKADHILESARRLMNILDQLTGQHTKDAHSSISPNVVESNDNEVVPVEMESMVIEQEPVIALRTSRKNKLKKLPDVLIVEDNLVNIQLLMIYIRRFCNIYSSRNAKSAILLCREQKFDAIFMDIHLGPGMNGIEALHEIHKIPGNEHVPVIAVTGYASYGDRTRFLNEGFADYIKKPIEREVVHEVMNRIFKKDKS